jgi:hypothetical protein
MNELVQRLSSGEHPVEVTLRPEKTLKLLKDCLGRGYVHVKFLDTKGGTELAVKLDPAALDFNPLEFDRTQGRIRLVGTLTLDYVPVRCIAEIDIETFAGVGRLERQGTPAQES